MMMKKKSSLESGADMSLTIFPLCALRGVQPPGASHEELPRASQGFAIWRR